MITGRLNERYRSLVQNQMFLKINAHAKGVGTALGKSGVLTPCDQIDCIQEIIDCEVEITDGGISTFAKYFTPPSHEESGIEMVGEPNVVASGFGFNNVTVGISFGDEFIAIDFAVTVEIVGPGKTFIVFNNGNNIGKAVIVFSAIIKRVLAVSPAYVLIENP